MFTIKKDMIIYLHIKQILIHRKELLIMKKFERAEIELLNISETAEGGKNIQQVDHLWTDNATGDLYASYASGGNTTGDPIDVIKPER